MVWRVRALVAVGVVAAGLVGGGAVAGAEEGQVSATCERGEFCLWPRDEYRGAIHRMSLDKVNPGECVPLPDGFDGRSFANRVARYVTVYQDRGCSPEGEFDTYPGGGTYVPQAPYLVRGVQVW